MNPTQPTGNDGQDAESSPAGPAAEAVVLPDRERALTADECRHLADMPPEVEWFANISNPRTRWAYRLESSKGQTRCGQVKFRLRALNAPPRSSLRGF